MPRKPVAPPPSDPAAERAFVDACSLFVASGEPYRILREFLNSNDASRRAWALDKLLAYGVGTPAARAHKDLEVAEMIRLAAQRARADLENLPLQLPPASPPLISGSSAPPEPLTPPPGEPLQLVRQASGVYEQVEEELRIWDERHRR